MSEDFKTRVEITEEIGVVRTITPEGTRRTKFVQIEKGSRLWAFLMLAEGKKLKHSTYDPNQYIYKKDNLIKDNQHCNVIVDWFEDGWEFSEEHNNLNNKEK